MTPTEPTMGFGPLPTGYPNQSADTSKRKKLAIAFVVGMVVLVGIGAALLFGNRADPGKEALLGLAVAQNELLRITDEHRKDLKSPIAKNAAAEVYATLTTSTLQLSEELKRVHKVKKIPGAKQKAAIDKDVDEKLASSTRLDRLDEDYLEVAEQKLTAQLELVQEAQGLAKNQKLKEVLAGISESITELERRLRAVNSS